MWDRADGPSLLVDSHLATSSHLFWVDPSIYRELDWSHDVEPAPIPMPQRNSADEAEQTESSPASP